MTKKQRLIAEGYAGAKKKHRVAGMLGSMEHACKVILESMQLHESRHEVEAAHLLKVARQASTFIDIT